VRAALALLALLLCSAASAEVAVPPLRSPVTDLTQTLTPGQVSELEQRLRDFETKKGSQVAVLIVPTTQPETIEQYSIRVAEAWKLGRKGVDDGVLLLVAKEDRAVRIEVGYGLEGALPDVFANRITDQVIVPHFRNGDYYGGISEGVTRIIGIIEGEPLPEAAPQGESHAMRGIGSALPLLLMFVFVAGGILRRIFGKFGGAALTGGVAGVLVWILTSFIAASLGAGVLAFLFALLTGGGGGWTNRGGGLGRGMGGGWGGGWGGGGWGGGGFGGGGFGGGGGWSGGGGGFGGGGASGRW
jgi:uncharacterized protein